MIRNVENDGGKREKTKSGVGRWAVPNRQIELPVGGGRKPEGLRKQRQTRPHLCFLRMEYRVLDLIARQGTIESTVFHVKLRWLPGFLKLTL